MAQAQAPIRIGILGLQPSDSLVLRTILRLSGDQLRHRWVFDTYQDADVVFINPQAPGLNETLAGLRRERRVMCVSVLPANANANAIAGTAVLKSPLRTAEVIKRLTDIEQQNGKPKPAAEAPIPTTPSPAQDDQRQKIKNALALTLQLQKESDRQRVKDLFLTVGGDPRIRVHLPESKFCFCDDEAVTASDGLRLLERLEWLQSQVGVETDIEDRPMPTPLENWLPLDCLYWHFGVQILCEDLLPGLNRQMSFKLKRWPDFGRIGSDPAHLKIAAFMTRRALTLPELKSLTRQPESTIVAFINACALCNLVMPQDKDGQVAFTDFSRLDAIRRESGGISNVISAIRSVFRLRT